MEPLTYQRFRLEEKPNGNKRVFYESEGGGNEPGSQWGRTYNKVQEQNYQTQSVALD